MSKVVKLKALIEHPNTPEKERTAAVHVLARIANKSKQIKKYEWVNFELSKTIRVI